MHPWRRKLCHDCLGDTCSTKLWRGVASWHCCSEGGIECILQCGQLGSELIVICVLVITLIRNDSGTWVRDPQADYPKVIIRSRYPFHKLAPSLLYHFHGPLPVAINLKIVAEIELGDEAQILELRVDKCYHDTCTQITTNSSMYESRVKVDSGWSCPLELDSNYPSTWDLMLTRETRQPLYRVRDDTPEKTSDYTTSLQIHI